MSSPLVSVGIPVYNSVRRFGGDTILRRSLESLFNQDHPNMEFVLVDNASDDGTWAVCQEYAQIRDDVRAYRNETNIGLHGNLNRSFELSRGEYFMIGSDDDYWEPNFASKCVQVLESQSHIDLCFPLVTEHNLLTNTAYPRSHMVKSHFQAPYQRAAHLLRFKIRPQTIILGVFRREALAEVMPVTKIPNGDLLLLYKFAFSHAYRGIPEVLGHKYVRPKPDLSEYSAQRVTIPTPRRIRQLSRSIVGFLRATLQAPISRWGRFVCLAALIGFTFSGVIYTLTLHKVRL